MPAAPSASSSATEVAVSHLELGDLVLVRPGALPPSDGTIVRGQSAFDESSLTGESRPVAKRIGDVVLTGTINVGREAVVVRVDSLGEDTMLSRIGKAVEGAMSGKSRIEELAERITGVFVPCIVRRCLSLPPVISVSAAADPLSRSLQVYFALIVLAIWLGLTLSGRIPDDWIKAHAIPTNGDKVFWAFEFCIAVSFQACLLRRSARLTRT
jgi:Cu+-exporting ATPase